MARVFALLNADRSMSTRAPGAPEGACPGASLRGSWAVALWLSPLRGPAESALPPRPGGPGSGGEGPSAEDHAPPAAWFRGQLIFLQPGLKQIWHLWTYGHGLTLQGSPLL